MRFDRYSQSNPHTRFNQTNYNIRIYSNYCGDSASMKLR